ncbi:helix-turn-helix domain-containing protein [Chitinophaga sp. 22536]|uniref:helix-turn-helix domain-containing protein n=1 Tax=unclassified Chitinophaga TaxID=2619133 RepID=UPI003F875FE9
MNTLTQILEAKGYDLSEQAEIIESGFGSSESLDMQVRTEFNMFEPISLWDGAYLIGEADEEVMTDVAQEKGYETYQDLLSAMKKRLIELAEELPQVDLLYHRRRIGEKIKALREEEGISQVELAERTGLLKQNISRIEQGKYSTGQDILSKIATALGKRLDIV